MHRLLKKKCYTNVNDVFITTLLELGSDKYSLFLMFPQAFCKVRVLILYFKALISVLLQLTINLYILYRDTHA